ncbi:ABC transporter substrate-binding protein [Aquamicrobium defluvii]|uniref:ABC transporter substrate-binding protein n=2 Tax=Aquamicrobium defluvii TaxID=69279 RepID=A0A011TCX5_9HYPH|nr:ABC transporter substrate-binding protein [Aquamicrobium defluvii]EXL09464.1 ABC transporter substrate-binding protein [Aquamicrobium defluvii]EZQ13656.1 ABC transporter substrate-binding protein [Halopseudomonas bauzanensis]TDR33526.1 peptide/nickel transport system substrate-binding protein [Aquamicrobium defluvii]
MKKFYLSACTSVLMLFTAASAGAAELRVAYKADPASLDSSANWDANTIRFVLNFYDPLLDYDGKDFIPVLAESWEQVEPTRWRFQLRKGVKFHDGRDFGAEDAMFSIMRATVPSSRAKSVVRGVTGVEKIDDHTFDVITDIPRPFLINMFDRLPMLSKSWAEENNALAPADVGKEQSNAALVEENGTGPFILERRDPGRQTTAVRNPDYWNAANVKSNIDRVTLVPISSDASRVAALLSGEVDLIVPAPMQDVARLEAGSDTTVWKGQEARGVFLGFDATSDNLGKDVSRGPNPFKDVRVRTAVYQAIDADAINRVVMRGNGSVANMIVPPGVIGYDPNRPRLPYDLAKARELLAEAGYPDGFKAPMECSNDRDIGDAATCEAVAAMLARAGIQIDLQSRPSTQFLSALLGGGASFYRFSWGNNGWAASNTMSDLAGCKPEGQRGFAISGYCNPELDELVKQINSESDVVVRDELTKKAWDILDAERLFVPLHYPPIFFASTKAVGDVEVNSDGSLRWAGVRKAD